MRFSVLLAFALSLPLAAFEGLSKLVGRAELIVRGKVQEKTIQRDATGRIVTEVKFLVSETWKGDPKTPLIKIISAGGTLGEVREVAVGESSFAINQDAVIFLIRNERGESVALKEVPVDARVGDLKKQVKEAAR